MTRKISHRWRNREHRKFSTLNVWRSFFLFSCIAACSHGWKFSTLAFLPVLVMFAEFDVIVGMLPAIFLPQMPAPFNIAWACVAFLVYLVSAMARGGKQHVAIWMPFVGNTALVDRDDPQVQFLLEEPVDPQDAVHEFQQATRVLRQATTMPSFRSDPSVDVRPESMRDSYPWASVVKNPTVKAVRVHVGTRDETLCFCQEFFDVLCAYMNVQMDAANPLSSKAARDGHNARYNFTATEWVKVSLDTVFVAKYYYKTMVVRSAAIDKTFDKMVEAANAFAHSARYWKRMAARKGPTYAAAIFCLAMAGGYHIVAGLGYNYMKLPEHLRATSLPSESAGVLTIPPPAVEAIRNESTHIGSETTFPLLPATRMYANPTPDFTLTSSVVSALKYRLMTKHRIDREEMARFSRFVDKEVAKFEPIEVMTPEQWLEGTHYSAAKKQEILEVLNGQRNGSMNTAFVKRECYPKFKAPRAIINASQEYKNLEGPVVASAQPLFESLPESLSGIPVKEWGHTVIEAFDDIPFGDTYVTDYSSFESSFGVELKQACESKFYHRIVEDPSLARKLAEVQEGVRKVVARNGVTYIRAAGRFSGDQRTYQGNTFTNIMVARYVLSKYHIRYRMFACGDDGLIRVPRGTRMPLDEFAMLGLKLKLDKTEIGTSDFCGFCFNPDNLGTRVAKDPMAVLLDVFRSYTRVKRKRALDYLYDRAICYQHEYPHDPVIKPVMDLIVTKFVKGRKAVARNYWTLQIMKDAELPEDTSELESFAFASEVTGLPETELLALRDTALRAVQCENLDILFKYVEAFDADCNEVRWVANHLDTLLARGGA